MISNDILHISEVVADAMVFLDPPNLPHKSNTVTPQNAKDAYDLLLSTNTKDIDQYYLITQDDQHHYNAIEPLSSQSTVGILADFYRTIILASTLLLEMSYWSQSLRYEENEYGTLSREQAEVLCDTIVHSIHRLRKMSTIVLSSYQYDWKMKKKQDDKGFVASAPKDWHDDTLPKSQYPLLQECFEREPLLDVETNIIFGMSPRIVSLRPEDYVCENVMIIAEKENENKDIYSNGQDHLLTQVEDDKSIENCDETMLPPIMMDPKQLEKEELELLYIALPNSSLRSRNKSISATSLKHLDETLEMCISNLSRFGSCNYIALPLHLGPCKILKSSPIIIKEMENDHHVDMHLFANGVFMLLNHAESCKTPRSDNTDFLHVWRLSSNSKCFPVQKGLTFHFSVTSVNAMIHPSKPHSCDLTLAVDETKGGSLKEGCDWINAFQMALSNIVLL